MGALLEREAMRSLTERELRTRGTTVEAVELRGEQKVRSVCTGNGA